MKMDMLAEITILNNGLPFDIKNPNEETQKALGELQNREGKRFKNVDELFADLDE